MPTLRMVALWCVAGLAGCTLTPEAAKSERQELERIGVSYEPVFSERVLPELPENPGWRDILSRAFLANGELEAAYFQWKAAVERIDAAGAWPNSDLSVGFSYAFSGERMKSFDRTALMLAPDAMRNLTLPSKAAKAADVAYFEAKATGERFLLLKFDLQRDVLFGWAEYTYQARAIRLKRQDLTLRRLESAAARAGISGGGRQEPFVASRLALVTAESDLADLEAEHARHRAELNALMARHPSAPLNPPAHPEPPRPLPMDSDALILAAAETFPEVEAMTSELRAAENALELARMRWIPDINPTLSIMGTVTQSLGAVVTLPTTVAEVRARIREAEAQVRAADARLRQRTASRIGEFVGLLIELDRARARAAQFRAHILPAARAIADLRQREYEAGMGSLTSLTEARKTELDAELMIAASEAQIEKAIVDIECCLGRDIETLHAPSTDHEGPTP
jgi:outer membrane protein, heavy metal efflux system